MAPRVDNEPLNWILVLVSAVAHSVSLLQPSLKLLLDVVNVADHPAPLCVDVIGAFEPLILIFIIHSDD